MDNNNFYNNYHRKRKLQKRLIREKNFTYRNIIKVLSLIKSKNNILDVGSGVGTIDFYLASKGSKVTGIEVSKSAIEVAKMTARVLNLEEHIKYINTDFLTWEGNTKYDLIICSEVLEHLENDEKAISKIHKHLRKGGKVIVTVPSKNAPLHKLGLADNFDKEVGHLRRYTMENLTRKIKRRKFRILSTGRSEGLLRNSLFVFTKESIIVRVANKIALISDILTFVDNLFIKAVGESQLIIVAQKV